MRSRALTNAEIADRLELFSALLELREASPFAARAYRRAAELVRPLPTPVSELVASGRIRHLRGIGPGIEARLRELVDTGELAELKALEQELDPELVGLSRLVGLSVDRMLTGAHALDVRDAAGLRRAAAEGRLQSAPGVGPATEAKIRARLEEPPSAPRGLTLDRALALSGTLAEALGGVVAGPARRYVELVHDLVVVCAGDDPARTFERFRSLPAVVGLLDVDDCSITGLTIEGVPVKLVVAAPSRFGTELVRATGSEPFVSGLEPLPEAPDEESVFRLLGMPFRVPELREPGVPLPDGPLVETVDLRGDLHCHTAWSDGRATILQMAEAAQDRGYEYLAICDHSPNVGVVHGLSADELRRQGEEIAAANDALAPFRVLRGVECDIRADGTLDVEESVLEELDWVQLSLHAGQRRPGPELTRMVTEAMRNPHVRALSHPKGRILGRRPENAVDLDEVFAVSVEHGVALEVNGLADRLDLSATHVREALEAGAELVLNSDAHSTRGLGSVELAVFTARRGGATASAVANTRPVEALARGRR